MSGDDDAASDDSLRVVLCSCPADAAGSLARAVLEPRLAACVNILPSVLSWYWWEGELQQDTESMLVIKTRASLVERLTRAIREEHPYDVPEIIALPLEEAGNADYLAWLRSETASTKS